MGHQKIYAIGAPEVGPGRVKIGFTQQDPGWRLKQLQTGSPVLLELVGLWPGSPVLEKELHTYFADKRLHLEWFEFGDQDPVTAITAVLESGVVREPATPEPAWKSASDPQTALRREVWQVIVKQGRPKPGTLLKMAARLQVSTDLLGQLAEECYRDRDRILRVPGSHYWRRNGNGLDIPPHVAAILQGVSDPRVERLVTDRDENLERRAAVHQGVARRLEDLMRQRTVSLDPRFLEPTPMLEPWA